MACRLNGTDLLSEPMLEYCWLETLEKNFDQMHLKMSSAKWQPFCLGPNVLTPAEYILTYLETYIYHLLYIDWCHNLHGTMQTKRDRDYKEVSQTMPRSPQWVNGQLTRRNIYAYIILWYAKFDLNLNCLPLPLRKCISHRYCILWNDVLRKNVDLFINNVCRLNTPTIITSRIKNISANIESLETTIMFATRCLVTCTFRWFCVRL